jgi:hypothetical protein
VTTTAAAASAAWRNSSVAATQLQKSDTAEGACCIRGGGVNLTHRNCKLLRLWLLLRNSSGSVPPNCIMIKEHAREGGESDAVHCDLTLLLPWLLGATKA